ncbi:uncharacterized protein LOC128554218 [Mercenaria mercenaria]|uniref:uncharacterized protein LOC128554218 n=1 Tax=Mercenaria mercenaria TaxID=6596 RepID=UPI00234F158D|nr:uncharacterized protein LOC128554218 [Mercenaria mercenaria]
MERYGLRLFLLFSLFKNVSGVTIIIPAVIEIGHQVMDILDLGRNILEFFDEVEEDKDDADIELLVVQIKDRIDSATTDIMTNVLAQSKLDKIDDAVITIHSLLIDLDNILHAQTSEDQKRLEKTFVSRFEQQNAVMHIRFLPELLQYRIPGSSGILKDLYTEIVRCNMSALLEFKRFYLELVSDGVALQFLHIHLTSSPSLNSTIEQWQIGHEKMNKTFYDMESGCINNFAKYANEDVHTADDARTLWKNNKERYPWKRNDVLFMKPYGTFQFLYIKHFGDYLFRHKANRNKIVIFTDKSDNTTSQTDLTSAKEAIKSAIGSPWDQNAAKNVGLAVEKRLVDDGYFIRALVVFFDGGEFASEILLFDEDSPVMYLEISHVQLSFCEDSSLKCAVDVINWFGGRKDVHGSMKICAYVMKQDNSTFPFDEIKHVTDTGLVHVPGSLTFLGAIVSFVTTVVNFIY